MKPDFPRTKEVQQIIEHFSEALDGVEPTYHIKERPDGAFIVLEAAAPSTIFYKIANKVNDSLEENHPFKDHISVSPRKKRPSNVLDIPETALLQKELAASLTVDRNTFGDDFLDRYTPSVTDLEKQIVVHTNHMVYGRRGSGKSSLLAYAMHQLRKQKQPHAWIAMQTYAGRKDQQTIASILSEILLEAATYSESPADFKALAHELAILGESDNEALVESRLSRLTPRLKTMVKDIARGKQTFTIFLDDLHVLDKSLQPNLLANIYSIARGNKTFIKASGIEQLTGLWNGELRRGLEAPHDVQILKLDHNLTAPDLSREHILSILNKHAKYCGLPDIKYLANDDLIDRLVLSAAAVPRDALSLFSNSIGRSLIKGQKSVSILSLNAATSDAIEEKLKDIQKDISNDEHNSASVILEKVKRFCMKQHKTNAFLVKIANSDPNYVNIQRLVALRFIHVLHEGTTPHKAGERFVALMLDYGFYIGVRTAKSVKLFPERPRQLLAKELRKLPILTHN